MSWLFKSFQASGDDFLAESQFNSSECVNLTATDPSSQEDFSALGDSLSRSFVNFLAPPPSPVAVDSADSFNSSSSSSSTSQKLRGIRNDLAEIGGGLRNGLSMLSVTSNKAVGKISSFASILLPFQSRSADDEDDEEFDDEEFEDEFIDDDAPGITDDVLNFVAGISSRPEYWTEFPLALDDTDFTMSDVQRIHTSTVEQFVPEISTLKIKLQSYISNEQFWMIYFILLLPRFDEHDLELLATPEIVEARNLLLDKFQRKEKSQEENSEDTTDSNLVSGTQKETMPSEETANSNKIIEGVEGLEIQDGDGDGDGDGENTNQRLEKEDPKSSTDAKEVMGIIEGILFSDVEDYGTDLSVRFSVTNPPRTSSSTESSDWVQLNENLDSKLDHQKIWKQDTDLEEDGDLSDWYNVNEFD